MTISAVVVLEQKQDVRRDVIVLQQIAEDVAQKAIRPTRVKGGVEPTACVVQANLCVGAVVLAVNQIRRSEWW